MVRVKVSKTPNRDRSMEPTAIALQRTVAKSPERGLLDHRPSNMV